MSALTSGILVGMVPVILGLLATGVVIPWFRWYTCEVQSARRHHRALVRQVRRSGSPDVRADVLAAATSGPEGLDPAAGARGGVTDELSRMRHPSRSGPRR